MTSAGAQRPRPWPGPRPGPPHGLAPGLSLPGPTVEVADEQAAVAVNATNLAELARAVLIDHGVGQGELSLSFVDEETITELNRRFLDGDGPTDVLAFPLDSPPDSPFDAEAATWAGDPHGVPVLLGDVAVCPAVAERNADDRAVALDDELALLVVHGVLHVLGMDHAEADEAAAMQACERRVLEQWRP